MSGITEDRREIAVTKSFERIAFDHLESFRLGKLETATRSHDSCHRISLLENAIRNRDKKR